MKFSEFLDRLNGAEEHGDGWLTHCPGHADSQASLRVSVTPTGKVLMKCRAGCKTPDVLSAMSLSLRDLATMEVDGNAGIPVVRSTDTPASGADLARLALQLDEWTSDADGTDTPTRTAPAFFYAEERFGLTLDDFARLGLGFAESLGGAPRLVVPFRDKQGVARGYQARALTPDASVRWMGPKNPEGASWTKVGWFEGASGWDEVFVTEGPGDSLTAVGAGYDSIMIRGAGLVSNEAVVDAVAEMVGDRLAVVAGDGDAAGRGFASVLCAGLVDRGIRTKNLEVPDDLDLTDWRKRDGVKFQASLIRAVSATVEETDTSAVLRGRDEGRFPLTDLGNARFVSELAKARHSGVKFSPETGFYLLHDGVWQADKLDRTRTLVQAAADRVADIASALPGGAQGTPEASEWKRWNRHATYSQSSYGINAAMKELQALSDVAVDVNDFDQHPHYLAVANGVVDLRSGELLPHNPALLLTRRLDIEFHANAKAPRWERFLTEVFPTYPDMPDYIRRLVGYGITGLTDEQAFAVLWGTGANGKSVFTDTLTEVFRDLTVTTPFSTFEEKPSGGIPNDIASLKGSRLVMAAEGDEGRPMAESVMKRITGKDMISARFMRREFFEFRPTFLLMLATNHKPKFRGQDEGLWRRVKMIPWTRYFAPDERDHRLTDTLQSEAQGILAWAVRGAVEWYAKGLQDPDVIKDATAEYREEMNVLNGFLPGEFVPDPNGKIKAPELFAAFMEYADTGNFNDLKQWSRQRFYSTLDARGYPRKKSQGEWWIKGVRKARPSDLMADEGEPEKKSEPERAEAPSLTCSKDTTNITGASLDDL